MSTMKSGNILATCYDSNKLVEYTTTCQLVREIPLQHGITNPTHAVQLDYDRFLVCHEGSLHRVCLIDNKGQQIKSYGEACGSEPGQLTRPLYQGRLSSHGGGGWRQMPPFLGWGGFFLGLRMWKFHSGGIFPWPRGDASMTQGG